MCSVSSGVHHSKCVCVITILYFCGCDVLSMGFENVVGHSIRQKASEFQRAKMKRHRFPYFGASHD